MTCTSIVRNCDLHRKNTSLKTNFCQLIRHLIYNSFDRAIGFIFVCGCRLALTPPKNRQVTILPPATRPMALRLQCLKPKAHNHSVRPDCGAGHWHYGNSSIIQISVAVFCPCFSVGTGLGWADLGWLGVQRVGGVSTVEAGALNLLSWWQAVNLILVSTNSHPERFSNLLEGNSVVNATFRFEQY